MSRFPTDLTTW